MAAIGGKAVTAVGSALKSVTTNAVSAGMSFESTMSSVAALSGATGSDFDKLSDKAKQLGASTKYTSSQIASAMEYSLPTSFTRYGVRKKLIPTVTANETILAIMFIDICFPTDFGIKRSPLKIRSVSVSLFCLYIPLIYFFPLKVHCKIYMIKTHITL